MLGVAGLTRLKVGGEVGPTVGAYVLKVVHCPECTVEGSDSSHSSIVGVGGGGIRV